MVSAKSTRQDGERPQGGSIGNSAGLPLAVQAFRGKPCVPSVLPYGAIRGHRWCAISVERTLKRPSARSRTVDLLINLTNRSSTVQGRARSLSDRPTACRRCTCTRCLHEQWCVCPTSITTRARCNRCISRLGNAVYTCTYAAIQLLISTHNSPFIRVVVSRYDVDYERRSNRHHCGVAVLPLDW